MHRLFTPEGGDADPRFQIGLSPVPVEGWFEGGEPNPADRKDALLAAHPALVRGAVEGSEPAQAEVAAMVADWLRTRGEQADLAAADLWSASRRVSDDLCLMEKTGVEEGGVRGPASWRLTAASLCAPTFFSAQEVVGLTLDAIHAPVPGFAATFAVRVARIFDGLRPDLVLQRLNWTVIASPDLFLPSAEPLRLRLEGVEAQALGGVLTVRRERQTVRRLPRTGGVLFTIRVWREPLAQLLRDPGRRAAFETAWAKLQTREAAPFRGYKGLDRLDAPVRALLARA